MNTGIETIRQTGSLQSLEGLSKFANVRPLKTHPLYPTRALVPLYNRPWERECVGYAPPFYEDSKLKSQDRTINSVGYADPADVSRDEFMRWSRCGYMKSFEGPIRHDPDTGRPLNPLGRVGIAGRGVLGKWGPNHAADAIVTRINESSGLLEVLLIQRKSGEWAIPGGMLDSGEMALSAAIRELEEETGVAMDSTQPHLVFRGVGDGPRITDNAWIETSAFHFHVASRNNVATSDLLPGTDVLDARWWVVTSDLISSLYSNHGAMIASAVELYGRREAARTDELIAQLATLPHQPLITEFSSLTGRIGILGGSFDPIHLGHVKLALVVKETFSLDSVVFLPTPRNPLKGEGPGATGRERAEMLQEALTLYSDLFVSPFELFREGPASTADVLSEISLQIDPTKSTLHFIVGSDCLRSLARWKTPKRILELAEFLMAHRKGESDPRQEPDLRDELLRVLGEDEIAKIYGRSMPVMDFEVSSSDVRRAIAAGEPLPRLSISAVNDYIGARGLYRHTTAFPNFDTDP